MFAVHACRVLHDVGKSWWTTAASVTRGQRCCKDLLQCQRLDAARCGRYHGLEGRQEYVGVGVLELSSAAVHEKCLSVCNLFIVHCNVVDVVLRVSM